MLRNVLLRSKPSSDYIFTHENTIRHTKPFFQKYDTRTKGRMLGKSFMESFCSEYVAPEDVFMQYCEHEFIKLNKKRVMDVNYVMGYKDSYQTEDIRTDKTTTNFDSIEVIYEDDAILVLAKPENVPVHKVGRYVKNNLIDILKREYSRFHPTLLPNGDLYPLHRIDRLTSGVLMLGKSSEVARDFSLSLRSKQVGKQYIAVTEGICHTEGLFKVDYPLMEIDPMLGIWKAVHSEESKDFIKEHYLHQHPLDWNNAKQAETLFQVLYRDYENNRTVFLCQPVTGRTHQIREHLFAIGYKIIGDSVENEDRTSTNMIWKEMAHKMWRWKLNSMSKHGFGNKKVIDDAIEEIIMKGEYQIPQSLGLFSVSYRYQDLLFECEIYRPQWINDIWPSIQHNMKNSELYSNFVNNKNTS